MVTVPILDNKSTSKPSVFAPVALLREARRQKGLATAEAPAVCILDPDGDLVREMRRSGAATPFADWPCYHTELDTFDLAGRRVGIVGRAVGAPFAVLVAEELFASGCKLLVSLTSAGQIAPAGNPPYFVVIDRALRDEGTSYHYAPPAEFAEADAKLVEAAASALAESGPREHNWGELDNRCALSRDSRSHRRRADQGHSRGRNGGRCALRVCPRRQSSGALPRPCNQYDGVGWR